MSLIISISGIRGTVGKGDDNLNIKNFIDFVLSFGQYIKNKNKNKKVSIVLGRDSRISGKMFLSASVSALNSLGIDVINLDLASTPCVEMAVIDKKTNGAIIISASHNSKEWNALKLLNDKGEFISAIDSEQVLKNFNKKDYDFVEIAKLGKEVEAFDYYKEYVSRVLSIGLIQKDLIKKRNFKIVVDAINSVGARDISYLLKKLDLNNVVIINEKMDGNFKHNPEPVDANLKQLCLAVKKHKADIGIAVDPDVDRIAFVDEKANYIGEESSLLLASKYILSNFKKYNKKYQRTVVSNMSSSMSLSSIAKEFNFEAYYSAVGEANVVVEMKKRGALIGGEGNGGIIFSDLHYGRDAALGLVFVLSYLALNNLKLSEAKSSLEPFYLLKKKIDIKNSLNIDDLFVKIEEKFNDYKIIKIDGLKLVSKNSLEWIHLRKSNTEPIVRIYCEAKNKERALSLYEKVYNEINNIYE